MNSAEADIIRVEDAQSSPWRPCLRPLPSVTKFKLVRLVDEAGRLAASGMLRQESSLHGSAVSDAHADASSTCKTCTSVEREVDDRRSARMHHAEHCRSCRQRHRRSLGVMRRRKDVDCVQRIIRIVRPSSRASHPLLPVVRLLCLNRLQTRCGRQCHRIAFSET